MISFFRKQNFLISNRLLTSLILCFFFLCNTKMQVASASAMDPSSGSQTPGHASHMDASSSFSVEDLSKEDSADGYSDQSSADGSATDYINVSTTNGDPQKAENPTLDRLRAGIIGDLPDINNQLGVPNEELTTLFQRIMEKKDGSVDEGLSFELISISQDPMMKGAGGVIEIIELRIKTEPPQTFRLAVKRPAAGVEELNYLIKATANLGRTIRAQQRQIASIAIEAQAMVMIDILTKDIVAPPITKLYFLVDTPSKTGRMISPRLATQLAEKGDLRTIHDYPVEDQVRMITETAEAVGLLNDIGIIHNDAAFRNFFITDDSHVIAGDFGLATFDLDNNRVITAKEDPASKDIFQNYQFLHSPMERMKAAAFLPLPQMPPEIVDYFCLRAIGNHPYAYDPKKTDPYTIALEIWAQIAHKKPGNTYVQSIISNINRDEFRQSLRDGKQSTHIINEIEASNLSEELKALFTKALSMDPSLRPTASEFARILKESENQAKLTRFIQEQIDRRPPEAL